MKQISAILIINTRIKAKNTSNGYTRTMRKCFERKHFIPIVFSIILLVVATINFEKQVLLIDQIGKSTALDTVSNQDKDELTIQKTDGTIVADSVLCPEPDEAVDATFPIGFPQKLNFGRYPDSKGDPFLSSDMWVDAVDNRRTFFLRPKESGFPTMKKLRDWIRTRPHPITLVMNNQRDKSWPIRTRMNNQHDKSWPEYFNNKNDYQLILNEPNLHAVYAGNAQRLEDYPKLKPLPIGLKWQYTKTQLFGEAKGQILISYHKNLGSTVEEVDSLFKSEKTSTVWLRPFANSNRRTKNYIRNTPALKTVRANINTVLSTTAPKSLVRNIGKSNQNVYFEEMKKHRFVISPAGNGLDTHSTWEALLAGVIPIVPKSSLDPLFKNLPVWLIDSWEEVTDEAVKRVEAELTGKTYDWEKLFTSFWKKEIYSGLCKLADE